MLKRTILYILLFLLVPIKLVGQYYNTGQDPASLKWELLSTDHFNFIYPTIIIRHLRLHGYLKNPTIF